MNADTYIIRGGVPGRERLRLLAEIVRPSTAALLARVGPAPGSHVLDLHGGGGDSTEELARCGGPFDGPFYARGPVCAAGATASRQPLRA